ncbi:ATP-dependent DNA helicase RecG, partial [Candidatus Hakubella thermalkaliphila]
YQLIKQEVDKGKKAYVICPLIDESDKMELKAVLQETEFLQNVVFKDYQVGLLHGQINSVKKAQIMEKFRGDGVDILISTTVIEVGVDVPEATVMLIENAERFGLAQLHQLRGRIGRKGDRSYCLLCADLREKEEAKKRIDAFIKISDGFKLAERDLFIRGEGQLFGERQSGFPDLKIASMVRHKKIIGKVREKAFAFLEDHRFRRSQKLLQACCHRLLPPRFFEDQG